MHMHMRVLYRPAGLRSRAICASGDMAAAAVGVSYNSRTENPLLDQVSN